MASYCGQLAVATVLAVAGKRAAADFEILEVAVWQNIHYNRQYHVRITTTTALVIRYLLLQGCSVHCRSFGMLWWVLSSLVSTSQHAGVYANLDSTMLNVAQSFTSALQDEKSRRSILTVRGQHVASMLPCVNCVELLKNAGSTVSKDFTPVGEKFWLDTWAVGASTSSAPQKSKASGRDAPSQAPFVLHKLNDGSWITQEYVQPVTASRSVLQYTFDLRGTGGFVYNGPVDESCFRFLSRISEAENGVAEQSNLSLVEKPPDSAAASSSSSSSLTVQRDIASGRPLGPPGSVGVAQNGRPCWYCNGKLWIHFVDMTTYPRPPRKFKMLLCRDDRIKALRQVVAAEVDLPPESLMLRYKNRDVAADENSTIAGLGMNNTAMIIISKKIKALEASEAHRPVVSGAAVGVDDAANDEGSDGVVSSAVAPAATGERAGSDGAGSDGDGGDADLSIDLLDGGGGSGGRSRQGQSAGSMAAGGPTSSSSAPASSPQQLDTTSSDKNRRLVDELLTSGNLSAAPPLSSKGPIASVDRRHGFSILGALLSHAAHDNVLMAWDAERVALERQAELLAELEAEEDTNQGKGGKSKKGKGKDKSKGRQQPVAVDSGAAAAGAGAGAGGGSAVGAKTVNASSSKHAHSLAELAGMAPAADAGAAPLSASAVASGSSAPAMPSSSSSSFAMDSLALAAAEVAAASASTSSVSRKQHAGGSGQAAGKPDAADDGKTKGRSTSKQTNSKQEGGEKRKSSPESALAPHVRTGSSISALATPPTAPSAATVAEQARLLNMYQRNESASLEAGVRSNTVDAVGGDDDEAAWERTGGHRSKQHNKQQQQQPPRKSDSSSAKAAAPIPSDDAAKATRLQAAAKKQPQQSSQRPPVVASAPAQKPTMTGKQQPTTSAQPPAAPSQPTAVSTAAPETKPQLQQQQQRRPAQVQQPQHQPQTQAAPVPAVTMPAKSRPPIASSSQQSAASSPVAATATSAVGVSPPAASPPLPSAVKLVATCPGCQSSVALPANFCSNCGSRVHTSEAAPHSPAIVAASTPSPQPVSLQALQSLLPDSGINSSGSTSSWGDMAAAAAAGGDARAASSRKGSSASSSSVAAPRVSATGQDALPSTQPAHWLVNGEPSLDAASAAATAAQLLMSSMHAGVGSSAASTGVNGVMPGLNPSAPSFAPPPQDGMTLGPSGADAQAAAQRQQQQLQQFHLQQRQQQAFLQQRHQQMDAVAPCAGSGNAAVGLLPMPAPLPMQQQQGMHDYQQQLHHLMQQQEQQHQLQGLVSSMTGLANSSINSSSSGHASSLASMLGPAGSGSAPGWPMSMPLQQQLSYPTQHYAVPMVGGMAAGASSLQQPQLSDADLVRLLTTASSSAGMHQQQQADPHSQFQLHLQQALGFQGGLLGQQQQPGMSGQQFNNPLQQFGHGPGVTVHHQTGGQHQPQHQQQQQQFHGHLVPQGRPTSQQPHTAMMQPIGGQAVPSLNIAFHGAGDAAGPVAATVGPGAPSFPSPGTQVQASSSATASPGSSSGSPGKSTVGNSSNAPPPAGSGSPGGQGGATSRRLPVFQHLEQ